MNEYINFIIEHLNGNSDFKHRKLKCSEGIIHIFYIDNLCDSKLISQFIVAPFMKVDYVKSDIEFIKEEILYSVSVENIKTLDEALLHILSGDAVIVFNFIKSVIYCEAKGFNKRNISTPINETVVKGPKEGFNEVLVDNISLIRRRIKNPNLEVQIKIIGKESNTAIALLYIKDVAPDSLINYVKKIVNNKDLDFLLGTNYIEEQLRCKGTSFDTIGYTEKPDIAASKILEGRIGILVDGTPNIITAPFFLLENFQAADDYYLGKHYTNFTRLLRILAFLISILTSGLYLALITYHFSLVPLEYVLRLTSSRADVPVPTILEILVMTFFFQLLREAGIRLPQPIGQAMSIVGALILGQSAVGAGLASQITVVVVALSSISSFLIPKLYAPIFFWNITIIFLCSLIGLVGFFIGIYILAAHLGSLNSCGYPYIFPLNTTNTFNYRDTVIRGDLTNISTDILIKDDEK